MTLSVGHTAQHRDPIRERQNRGIPKTVNFRYPDPAMHQGGGDQKRLGELRFDHLVGRRFAGSRPNSLLCPAWSASTVTD